MPYMYILKCSDGSYYTGSTKNLEKRLWEHQNGLGANYTKKHLPVKLAYCEEYDRVDHAFYREKQVQGWSRKKKEALINGEFEKLPVLARNYTQFGVASTHFDKLSDLFATGTQFDSVRLSSRRSLSDSSGANKPSSQSLSKGTAK